MNARAERLDSLVQILRVSIQLVTNAKEGLKFTVERAAVSKVFVLKSPAKLVNNLLFASLRAVGFQTESL
jgi:hypothetical protein